MLKGILSIFALTCFAACSTAPKRMDVAAPMPPVSNVVISPEVFENIQPAAGPVLAMNETGDAVKKCGFSSHRKNTIGYEIDPSRHIGFNVNPGFDVWNPTDFDPKVKLTFTKNFGGPANKRPKCTFGSGFYGMVPYAFNKGIDFDAIKNPANIKSYVQEKLEMREQRRREREQAAARGI